MGLPVDAALGWSGRRELARTVVEAERFIRTMRAGRACGAIYGSSRERTTALDGRLWHCNQQNQSPRVHL
jgi:hypothetical protein